MAHANENVDRIREDQWQACLNDLRVANAELIAEGRRSRGRRVYRHQDRIYKIAFFGYDEESSRNNDLQREFRIVRHCQDLKSLPTAYQAEVRDQYEFAIYQRVEGELLSDRAPGVFNKLPVLTRLVFVLLRISFRGVSHNDLCPDNIVIRPDGSVILIDFDQATRGSWLPSLYRNFCYLRSDVVCNSFLRLILSLRASNKAIDRRCKKRPL